MNRIIPLPEAEWTQQQRRVLIDTSPNDEPASGNWYQALVRHPGLHAKWVAFGAQLLVKGKLAARDRELLVLRTAWRTGAEYYWDPHVRLAHEAGITPGEIDAVTDGRNAGAWDDHDRALLNAVDELISDNVISDTTWATLARSLDERQLIEVPFLVGHYVMVACTMRSIGVALEPGQGGFEVR